MSSDLRASPVPASPCRSSSLAPVATATDHQDCRPFDRLWPFCTKDRFHRVQHSADLQPNHNPPIPTLLGRSSLHRIIGVGGLSAVLIWRWTVITLQEFSLVPCYYTRTALVYNIIVVSDINFYSLICRTSNNVIIIPRWRLHEAQLRVQIVRSGVKSTKRTLPIHWGIRFRVLHGNTNLSPSYPSP